MPTRLSSWHGASWRSYKSLRSEIYDAHNLRFERCDLGLKSRREFRWSSSWRPVELAFAPVPSCTAQPRARGSKYYLDPSSWARAVPVLRLVSCWRECVPWRCQITRLSRCRSSLRVRWKVILTREIENLAARCQRASAHDTRPSWRSYKSFYSDIYHAYICR